MNETIHDHTLTNQSAADCWSDTEDWCCWEPSISERMGSWLRWRVFETQMLTRWAFRWEHSQSLGTVAGIDIRLHNVWLFFLLLDALMASVTVPHTLPEWPLLAYPLFMLVAAVALHLCAILPHELAHAAVAKAVGRRVERVMIYGAGGCMVSYPRPDEPWWALALIAGVGPLTNVVVGLCWALVAYQLRSAGADLLQTPLGLLSLLLASTNALAVLINSIPAGPVDGGLVAMAFRSRRSRAATA